jgi:hypothetical protein
VLVTEETSLESNSDPQPDAAVAEKADAESPADGAIGTPVTDAPETAGVTDSKAADADAKAGVDDGPEAGPVEEGLDPQLVGLCVVLWIVACGIFLANWESLKINWYLGNIMETLGPKPLPGTPAEQLPLAVDQASIDELVKLAANDSAVIDALRKELNSRRQQDQRYRVLMLVVAEKIPGDESFQLLVGASLDYDYRLRINAYRALSRLGTAGSAEQREQAFQVVFRGLKTETDPLARMYAASMIGMFKDPRPAWDLVRVLRDATGQYRSDQRAGCVKSLRAISGKTKDEIPFGAELEGDAFDAQLRLWEEWFKGQGGEIPAGESLDEVRRAQRAAGPTSKPTPEPGSDTTEDSSNDEAGSK